MGIHRLGAFAVGTGVHDWVPAEIVIEVDD
jgi:hypothetical protein